MGNETIFLLYLLPIIKFFDTINKTKTPYLPNIIVKLIYNLNIIWYLHSAFCI